MRTAWLEPEYIVNITKNLVGISTLSKIETRNPRALFLLLETRLTPKLQEMGSDTLGKICAYGTSDGFHNGGPLAQTVGFMNLTGFKKVRHYDFEHKKDGHELLVEMAVSTIVCIAFDIIHQFDYVIDREKEREEDNLWERCEHEMTHGNVT